MVRTGSILLLIFACACGAKSTPADGKPVAGIPTDAAEMFTFLTSGEYKQWTAESAVHKSSGPHGMVRTFANETLTASLTAKNTEHPVGSAAIKELYKGDGTTLRGWAVELKASAGAGGATWYWYEVFSTTDGSSPVADGLNHSTCTGCHSRGLDYVRAPFPFE